jgi:hypothetical protein
VKRLGGNFTQPAVDLFSGEIRYLVYLSWHRQRETFETALEAENALLALRAGTREPVDADDQPKEQQSLEPWL